jgi:hypothetical protein
MKFRKNIGAAKPQLDIHQLRDNPEWQLAESVVAEFTDATGIKILYYRKDTSIESDTLYGETQDVEYHDPVETKILYEVGEIPTLYSMFGMMATDQIVAHIPQCIYHRDVDPTEMPKPGDVIKVYWYRGDFDTDPELTNRTFEISHVAQDQAIFQLRSLVYVMYLMPYRFSEESDSARDAASDLDTTMFPSISSFGDNEWIDTQSQAMSAYDGIDTGVYGY